MRCEKCNGTINDGVCIKCDKVKKKYGKKEERNY